MPPLNFTDVLAAIDSAISSEAFHGYGPREIPHELDRTIEDFLTAYLQSARSDRELLGCLPGESVNVLLAFAERQDTKIMLKHYSAEVLFSQEARAAFLQPDIAAIPQLAE